jgi:hypothetical protein
MVRAIVLLGAVLVSGCSYSMHEYQAAGYAAPSSPPGPPRQAAWIHASAHQRVILGVTDNTDYVDEAYARLVAQCPGDIVGLNTRYSTALSFLSYKETVDVQAFCLSEPPAPGAVGDASPVTGPR